MAKRNKSGKGSIYMTIGVKQYRVTPAQLNLFTHLRELKLEPVMEHRFCERLWRFDVAVPSMRLAFECNGSRWNGHQRRRGQVVDDENEKLNRAQLEGWRVMRFTDEFVLEGDAKKFLKAYL